MLNSKEVAELVQKLFRKRRLRLRKSLGVESDTQLVIDPWTYSTKEFVIYGHLVFLTFGNLSRYIGLLSI